MIRSAVLTRSTHVTDGQTNGQTNVIGVATRYSIYAVACKKGRKGKGRYTKSQVGYISPVCGADPFGPIFTKIGTIVGFWFQYFYGFLIYGGRGSKFTFSD